MFWILVWSKNCVFVHCHDYPSLITLWIFFQWYLFCFLLYQEIDTALLKLYAENNSPDLVSFIVSSSACDMEDCDAWLQKYGHHHAMALLHKYRGDNDKAIAVWIRSVKAHMFILLEYNMFLHNIFLASLIRPQYWKNWGKL